MGDPVMCCLLGICCPPADQRKAWIELFMSRVQFGKKSAEVMTDVALALEKSELQAFAEALVRE
jgi:hypothetical protein